MALQLEGLHRTLASSAGGSHPHLVATLEEMRSGTARLLRELADLAQVHRARAPAVLDHLNVVLPCLSRSLRDITSWYANRRLTCQNRWRGMYHSMKDEAGGLLLPQRFLLYSQFLMSLRDLLTRWVCFVPWC